jgi:hypothetical protein
MQHVVGSNVFEDIHNESQLEERTSYINALLLKAFIIGSLAFIFVATSPLNEV